MPSLPTIFSQSATVGTPFSLTFSAATGGDPPLTYSVSAGNRHGLRCLVSHCQARQDATGTHQVRVTVEDDDGDTDFRAFIITVSAAADLTPALPAIDKPDGDGRNFVLVSLSTQQPVATLPWIIQSVVILLGLLFLLVHCRVRPPQPERIRSLSRSRTMTVTLIRVRLR